MAMESVVAVRTSVSGQNVLDGIQNDILSVKFDDDSTCHRNRDGLDHLGSAGRDLLHGVVSVAAWGSVLRISGVAGVEGRIMNGGNAYECTK